MTPTLLLLLLPALGPVPDMPTPEGLVRVDDVNAWLAANAASMPQHAQPAPPEVLRAAQQRAQAARPMRYVAIPSAPPAFATPLVLSRTTPPPATFVTRQPTAPERSTSQLSRTEFRQLVERVKEELDAEARREAYRYPYRSRCPYCGTPRSGGYPKWTRSRTALSRACRLCNPR